MKSARGQISQSSSKRCQTRGVFRSSPHCSNSACIFSQCASNRSSAKETKVNRSMGQGVLKPREGSSKNQWRPSVLSYQESKSRMGDASSPSSSVKVHPKLPQAQTKTNIKENDKPTSAIIIFLSARMSHQSEKIYNTTAFNTTPLIFKYSKFSLLSYLPSPRPRSCESQWSDQMVTLDWP